MVASRTSPSLPSELIQMAIAELWSQVGTTDERCDLYDTLRAAHPLLHELLVAVAVRHPCFTFSASRRDIKLYRMIFDQAASFAGATAGTEENATTVPQGVHVLLDITPLVDLYGTTRTSYPHWEEYVSVLKDVVTPECSSFTFLGTRPVRQHITRLALSSLLSYSSLTHLYLNYDHQGHACVSYKTVSPIPSVRFLRLKQYMTCNCDKPNCLRRVFLHVFPNIGHLHLEQPTILKLLDPPHSLHTATLEAPLLQPIPGLAPSSSLVGYNITAALRRGFLQWRPRRARAVSPPTIVVYTSFAEPIGFEQARAACAEHGVALRREIVYMQ
ncbi:hypothetical protein OH76DRAFT_1399084 [Lentinus brumalis]|uniref:Uncharacterized protein n=1 Tax=Lentinus brumalis TaxID=2498619 RepID=A0A371DN00_9APHY|nr:hypothetical protein OH76DRAFT_1399084 [Polyporus brumalis]